MGRQTKPSRSRQGNPPRGLTQTLRRIRRRRLIDLGLRRCGRSLAVALFLATAVLLVDRLFGLGLPLLVYVAIAVTGLLVGVIRAARAAPEPARVAIDIDRRLRLQDRLGTALALEHGVTASTDAQFAELVRRDAEGRAARIDPRSSAPIRLHRAWILVVALAALWPAAAQLLPARLLPRPQVAAAAGQTPEQAEERQEVAQTLERATSPLREQLPNDPVVTEQLDALDQLAEQLEADPTRPVDEIREESAARMDELADRLADEAERNLEATEQVTRRFDSMPEAETPMSTDELLEAMRRGDFGEAADALDELLSRGDELSPAQRRQLAEALRELGRVAETPPADATDLDEPSARLRQTLRDQGLDEQTIRQLMDDPAADADSLEQSLAERGVDREIARDLARDLETLNREERVQRETQDQAETIRDAMNDTADRLDEPSAAGQESDQPPDTPDGAPRQQPTETPDGQPQTQPNETPDGQPQTQPTETPDGQPQTQPTETPDGKPQTQPNETPDGQPQTQPNETPDGKPQTQPTETPDGQPQTQPSETPDGQPQTQPSETPDGTPRAQPSETPDGQPQTQPSETPDGKPRAQPPETPDGQPQTQPNETPDGQPQTQPPETPDGQPQTQPTETPGGQPQAQPTETPDGKPQTQPTETPDGQTQTQPTGTPDAEPQIDPNRSPAETGAPTPSETPPNADRPPSPGESLRELARRRSESRDRMGQSETLREAARRMANNDEPRAPRPEGGRGPGTATAETPPADAGPLSAQDAQDLDISGERTDGETAARWLTDENDLDAPSQADARRTRIVRDAQQVAERAVNESAVPKRYHRLIRRYFDRLQETVDRAAESPPPNDG